MDGLRDAVRGYVVERLGSDLAGLVADDAQVIKKRGRGVGVASRCCGLTGQMDNCEAIAMPTQTAEAEHA